jgi:hypothetical protein
LIVATPILASENPSENFPTLPLSIIRPISNVTDAKGLTRTSVAGTIRNDGDKTIAFSGIKGNCGCLETNVDPMVLDPGEEAQVSGTIALPWGPVGEVKNKFLMLKAAGYATFHLPVHATITEAWTTSKKAKKAETRSHDRAPTGPEVLALPSLSFEASTTAKPIASEAEVELPDLQNPDLDEQITCPFRGIPIDPNKYVDHNGLRIWVCCDPCWEITRLRPNTAIKILAEKFGEKPTEIANLQPLSGSQVPDEDHLKKK